MFVLLQNKTKLLIGQEKNKLLECRHNNLLESNFQNNLSLYVIKCCSQLQNVKTKWFWSHRDIFSVRGSVSLLSVSGVLPRVLGLVSHPAFDCAHLWGSTCSWPPGWGWILSSLDRWTATLTIVSLCLCDIVPRCALPDLPVSLCTGFGPHQWCGWEHCKYWTGWTPLGPLTPWHICSLIVNKRTELPNRVCDWVACLFLRDIQKQFVNQNLWYILYIKLGLHVTCKSCNNTLH